MSRVFTRNWRAVVVQGAVAILFGLLTLVWLSLLLRTLVLLFGAYALLDGIFAVVASINARRSQERWWGTLLRGIVSILIGLFALLAPDSAANLLRLLIAIWAIATGASAVIAAIQLRRVIDTEWLMIISRALSIVFGIFLLFSGAGALDVAWLIAVFAIALGILFVILDLRLRRIPSDTAVAGEAG